MGDANPLNMDPELQKKLVELDKELAEGLFNSRNNNFETIFSRWYATYFFFVIWYFFATHFYGGLTSIIVFQLCFNWSRKNYAYIFLFPLRIFQSFLVSGDITEKGYQKKKAKILERFHVHYYESVSFSQI